MPNLVSDRRPSVPAGIPSRRGRVSASSTQYTYLSTGLPNSQRGQHSKTPLRSS